MQDKTLKCRDCGKDFTFTASEQEFYAQKGFTNEPGRCADCRAANKAARGEGGFGGARRDRQMYPAVCATCGKETQVPFEPRNDKPVYCSDCYSSQRPSGGSSSYGNNRGGGGSSSRDGGRRRTW